MRPNVTIGSIVLLFFLTLPSALLKHATASNVGSDKVQPETDFVEKVEGGVRRIPGLIQAGRFKEATDEWEHAFSEDQDLLRNKIAWDLAQAYLKQKAFKKAIEIYKPQHHFITESIDQRAQLGELLLFGKVGARPKGVYLPIGEAQCAICHAFTKESRKADPFYYPSPPWGPHLFSFSQRIKRRIAGHHYQQRPKDTTQPEAFPGSGIATSVIEYLAESNVCPSCYVVPGFGMSDTQDRQSPMPWIHRPPISLTIDEMVAIDTWLLREDGADMPSLEEMRAAYKKFLRPEERPPNYEGFRLGLLYDAKGDLTEAIRLIEENYQAMLYWNGGMAIMEKLRNDPQAFRDLKQKPKIVAKFPILLQTKRR